MNPILLLGCSRELVECLARQSSARIHSAGSLGDARTLIRQREYDSVVVDLAHQPVGYDELCALMGEAPLTTRFMVLRGDLADEDADALARVGVTILIMPKELVEQLAS